MQAALVSAIPTTAPDAGEVMARAAGENFPVAMRILAPADRRHLLAVYGFARLADELGDSIAGDRMSALDWLERELERVYEKRCQHPVLLGLQATLREKMLPREPFLRLIEANRLDQRVTRYETWRGLLDYCELSANPVGELVLHIFDLSSPTNIELSNRICTALQLVEHWQDVREDLLAGRIYLPAEDLNRFGLTHDELADAIGPVPQETRSRVREVIAFEVMRTRELLESGSSLVHCARGRRKLALAAFVAGGRAALRSLKRAGYEVLDPPPPHASRTRRSTALAGVLLGSRP